MELNIRKATLADRDIVAEYNILLARETENLELPVDVVRAGVEALLRDETKGTYFVAVSDNEVIGQLLTHEWSDWRNGDFWWIQSVYVRSDFRRRGIFKALFNFVSAQATAAPDVCGLRLYMENNNSRARQTYRSLGMLEPLPGVRENLYADGANLLSVARKTHIHLLVAGWRGRTPVHCVVNNLAHPGKPPLRPAAAILSVLSPVAASLSVEAEFHLIDTI